jgi:hypothetical protein
MDSSVLLVNAAIAERYEAMRKDSGERYLYFIFMTIRIIPKLYKKVIDIRRRNDYNVLHINI